jgi:hypothetical protein
MKTRPFSRRARCALGGLLALVVLARSPRAEPVISEFLASNARTLADDTGTYADWIEIHNPDPLPVNLAGWHLTDTARDLAQWTFPAVVLPPGGHLLVWASGRDRREPGRPLHTNFELGKKGEYLALVKPDGVTVTTEFAPVFPAQSEDVSYGLTSPVEGGGEPVRGYFRVPTPGAANPGPEGLFLAQQVSFSRAPGPFAGSLTLELSGAGPGQRIRYTLTPPSAVGAADLPEPSVDSPEYTGPLTLSASVVVRASVYTADDLVHGLPATAHYVRLGDAGAARLDNFDSQLPLLVIDTHGTGGLVKDGINRPCWIYAWPRPAAGGVRLTEAPAVWTAGTTKVRGQSSADFPKKSYSLAALDALGGTRAVALPGFPAFGSWKLIGPWSYDRTYLYNAFVYALSNRLGRWAPRTQLVEVFLNLDGGDLDLADHAGIYVLTDGLDVGPGRIDLAPLGPGDVEAPRVTGGYVFKIDVPDPDEFSFRLARGFPADPVALVLDSTKAASLLPAQAGYLRSHLQAFDDALWANQAAGFVDRTYGDFIDLPSWIDHHLLNVLVLNCDGLTRSAYFTKDRGGRIVAGPVWDFDRSLGGADPRVQDPLGWRAGEGGTDYFAEGWWGTLAQDPEFVQGWIDRWQALRTRELATASLDALIDGLAAQIGPAAAARDAARWPDNASRFPGGWSGEVANLKAWLARRTAWIDAQFTAAPSVTAGAEGMLSVTPAPGSLLVYTTDGTDPRGFGGGIATGAGVAMAPVVVPAAADLQARSYRLGAPSAPAPASGWSGLAGGGHSSKLGPRPRLINVSSLGVLGSEDEPLTVGLVVGDTAGKSYLARAVGPGLAAFGVEGPAARPVLLIRDTSGHEIARNAGWETGPLAEQLPEVARQVGAFPLARGSADSAVMVTLPTGAYALQVSNATGETGPGLLEVYEMDAGVGRTLSLATLGWLRDADDLLTSGLVVRGPGPKRVLVRAVGPAFRALGIQAVLDDPRLELYAGQSLIAGNEDWSVSALASEEEVAAASAAAGCYPLDSGSKDAALLVTLKPGVYTAQVRGGTGRAGVVLLEIHEVR